MKAVVLKKFGSVDHFAMQEMPTPIPNKGEVLLKIKSIGLNPVDYKTRQGGGIASRMQAPIILGWDISGIVITANSENPKFAIDAAVFGMVNFPGNGNAYAEYVIVPEDQLSLKPESISFEEAAALPLASLTAYQALFKIAKVKKGDRVLVHAAAGGVGHLAIQMLKNIGAHTIGTASAKKEPFLKQLGLDEFIDYTTTDFSKVCSDIDIVFDGVGGEVGEKSMATLKSNGTLISIPSGIKDDWKKIRSDVNTPSFLVESSGVDMETIATMVENKQLNVTISKRFPLQQVAQAHLALETNRTQGKIVLTVS